VNVSTVLPQEHDAADVGREPPALVERSQLREAVELEVLHADEVGVSEDPVHEEFAETVASVLGGDDDVEDEGLERAVREDPGESDEVHRLGSAQTEDVVGVLEHAPGLLERAAPRPPLVLIQVMKLADLGVGERGRELKVHGHADDGMARALRLATRCGVGGRPRDAT
jgi:hypothetical protein